MEIIEHPLILLGIAVAVIMSIPVIINVATFYRTRFGFSVWSGALILLLVFGLVFFNTYSISNSIVIFAISSILCLFTLYKDIKLSGGTYGLLGFLFQAVMAFIAALLIIIILARILARTLTRRKRKLTGIPFRAMQEMHYAIVLFPLFMRI